MGLCTILHAPSGRIGNSSLYFFLREKKFSSLSFSLRGRAGVRGWQLKELTAPSFLTPSPCGRRSG